MLGGGIIEKIANTDQLNSKCTITISKKSKLTGKELVECVPVTANAEAKENAEIYTKTKGPADSTRLLDNFNIDDTLKRFSALGSEMFNKKFYHVGFQMIDFLDTESELTEISLADLKKQGYDSMGVVFNTDVSTGRGKHWFCVYVDLASNPITIEHFNSSGRAARESVSIWMSKQATELREAGYNVIEIKNADKIVQKSNTECGMWSLIYILWRLLGHSRTAFYASKPTDDEMIKLRKLLFNS